ncbi:MAG TPA: hypothetical protein VMF31_05630 [Solirubrobacterales bacterium]|nr:hypothetical protein [Solirubrobacterales bacterium]
MIYKLIGRTVVWFGIRFLKKKFVLRTAVLTGAGVVAGITVVGVAGYLVTRDVPEG